MIKLDNRKVIYRYKWFQDSNSNLIYCHFLVDGKTLSNMFYWRVDLKNIYNVGFYHTVNDEYDQNDISHYIEVYKFKKVFHVYVLQDAMQIKQWNDNKELKIRLITIDNNLIQNNNNEKSEKYLI